jgi:hypothetical protein
MAALCAVILLYGKEKENREKQLHRTMRISNSDLGDVLRMMTALAWPEHTYSSRRNRYSITPLLSACIVLRRLSTSCHVLQKSIPETISPNGHISVKLLTSDLEISAVRSTFGVEVEKSASRFAEICLRKLILEFTQTDFC